MFLACSILTVVKARFKAYGGKVAQLLLLLPLNEAYMMYRTRSTRGSVRCARTVLCYGNLTVVKRTFVKFSLRYYYFLNFPCAEIRSNYVCPALTYLGARRDAVISLELIKLP